MSDHWSRDEVELIVADYFAMLTAELSGRAFNKAEHRRRLIPHLRSRTEGAVEFKHQNISAVLINSRLPYISGYKPGQNYQALLETVVLEYLSSVPEFFQEAATSPVLNPVARRPIAVPVDELQEEPPEVTSPGVDASYDPGASLRFKQVDFIRRDAENRVLGRLGEEWVIEFEQRRLHDQVRRPDLARRVEWSAQEHGDGLGYDVRSFNADESPRLVEVKTTGLGKHFPFIVTSNEVRVSKREMTSYYLYRVLPSQRVQGCSSSRVPLRTPACSKQRSSERARRAADAGRVVASSVGRRQHPRYSPSSKETVGIKQSFLEGESNAPLRTS